MYEVYEYLIRNRLTQNMLDCTIQWRNEWECRAADVVEPEELKITCMFFSFYFL